MKLRKCKKMEYIIESCILYEREQRRDEAGFNGVIHNGLRSERVTVLIELRSSGNTEVLSDFDIVNGIMAMETMKLRKCK
jgi:hypothetical protein